MAQICTTPIGFTSSVYPTVDSIIQPIMQGFYSVPWWGRQGLTMPTLASMASCPWIGSQMPDVSMPSMEAIMYGMSVQSSQSLLLVDLVIGAITDLVPALPIPEIPGLGINLADLLSFNPEAILETITSDSFDIDALTALIPNIPDMWEGISIKSVKAVKVLQYAVSNYISIMTNHILALVEMLLTLFDDLEIPYPAMPLFGAIPTMDTVKAAIEAALDLPTWPGFIVIGAFPPIPFSFPIRVDGTSKQLDLEYLIGTCYQSMRQGALKLVLEWISTFPSPFTFPALPNVMTLIGELSIPVICYDDDLDLPNIPTGVPV